jgi:hypothetical protein
VPSGSLKGFTGREIKPTSLPSFQHSLLKADQFDQQSWDTINRFLDSSDRVTRFQNPSANILKPAKQEEQEANCFSWEFFGKKRLCFKFKK